VKSGFFKGLVCSLLAALLVLARTADAHLHYCFDGKEPAVSIHIADSGSHPCETSADSGHSGDQDVQLASDILVKKAAADDAWAPAVCLTRVEFITRSVSKPLAGYSQGRVFRPAYFMRPPLRGPPV